MLMGLGRLIILASSWQEVKLDYLTSYSVFGETELKVEQIYIQQQVLNHSNQT